MLKMWCRRATFCRKTQTLRFDNLQISLSLWKKNLQDIPSINSTRRNSLFSAPFSSMIICPVLFSVRSLTYRPKLFSIILLPYFSKIVWCIPKLPFIWDYWNKSFSILSQGSETIFFQLCCLKLGFCFYIPLLSRGPQPLQWIDTISL